MMLNIFSGFDPMWFNLCYKNTLFMTILLMLIFSTTWRNYSSWEMSCMSLLSYSTNQHMKTKMKLIKSSSLLVTSLLLLIIYMNLTGMLPYIFSVTSQIIFTMSLGLPMWLYPIMSSMSHSTKKTISHLLPDGAPLWLNPFLVTIESISIMVRPITLSFRLAANMTAGHVVLTLMTSFSASLKTNTFITITLLSNIYTMFEFGICVVQAYIFCLLVSLYINDHA